jgi:hypothetical protein
LIWLAVSRSRRAFGDASPIAQRERETASQI